MQLVEYFLVVMMQILHHIQELLQWDLLLLQLQVLRVSLVIVLRGVEKILVFQTQQEGLLVEATTGLIAHRQIQSTIELK